MEDVVDNWNDLSDADWNEKLDERIDSFNRGKGEIKLPPPPHAIMDEEYSRGILNKLATEDLIRHYADAIGDPNPIWRDPTYAQGTRWGGIIAPPTFESCISFGSSFGGRLRVPGVARLAAGNGHDYLKPIRPGDTFSVYDKYNGFVEKDAPGKAYRMFIENVPRYFVNQRDEVVAIATHRNIYMATPPSKRAAKTNKPYADKKRHHFSKDELEQVHQSYEDQLSGKFRRGAQVRYWEDVNEGDELPVIAKGPYDVCDAGARTTVSCYVYSFAIKWAAMRNHLDTHPIDPETGEHRFRRDWHYEDHAARMFGYPYANVPGIHMEMMLVHSITDWMGDDAFVRSMDSQARRMLFLGDLMWIKGKVTRKFTENNERLVELDVWGENQDGVVCERTTAVVKLVSRAD
ncbi:MaoC family dehydratase N-terminal domain-containing protein [Caballeronia sp. ATUFL_M1_KS5A]|uniref:FAS1-like dehydratase domain-containing protein n=1 Tax=Caballeronia sp. ATUFL_M1_KS5A TaxID=2921778 RepID=UPI0020294BAA|nr:MaoC family dehydratase N-terminal domain-containing protein [Caballeronia sp. ATUFL_M1_KS5A]